MSSDIAKYPWKEEAEMEIAPRWDPLVLGQSLTPKKQVIHYALWLGR